MGMQSASMQTPYSSAQQGKGQGLPNPEASMSPSQPTQQGKGQGSQGAITFPGQGGQPAMGQPNAYPNTINSSDNTGMSQPMNVGGKSGGSAKGAR